MGWGSGGRGADHSLAPVISPATHPPSLPTPAHPHFPLPLHPCPQVHISAPNLPPSVEVASSSPFPLAGALPLVLTEDHAAIPLKGVSLSDPDLGPTATITVAVSARHGTVAVGPLSGGTAWQESTSLQATTNGVLFDAPLEAANSALASLMFVPKADYNGVCGMGRG